MAKICSHTKFQSSWTEILETIFEKNCCESTYQNLSSFQNLYQLLSYLENWACWTWFALNFLGMLSEHKIVTFAQFSRPEIWLFSGLVNFVHERVVLGHRCRSGVHWNKFDRPKFLHSIQVYTRLHRFPLRLTPVKGPPNLWSKNPVPT